MPNPSPVFPLTMTTLPFCHQAMMIQRLPVQRPCQQRKLASNCNHQCYHQPIRLALLPWYRNRTRNSWLRSIKGITYQNMWLRPMAQLTNFLTHCSLRGRPLFHQLPNLQTLTMRCHDLYGRHRPSPNAWLLPSHPIHSSSSSNSCWAGQGSKPR
jgi:hypothetical protein